MPYHNHSSVPSVARHERLAPEELTDACIGRTQMPSTSQTLVPLLALQLVTSAPTFDPFAFFRPSILITADDRRRLDRGEPLGAAAIREAREECGLDVRLDGLVNIYSYPGETPVIVVYAATALGGTLAIDGQTFSVTGLSWMDHEFGTSFLEEGQIGWDWLSIQLEDDRDLMIFQLRRSDGTIDARSSGTLVERASTRAGGTMRPQSKPITLENGFHLEPGRTWTSPASRAAYPVVWRVLVPSEGLDLTVRAAVDAQELHTAESTGVSYWEGAIDVTGRSGGRAVKGRGYLEMTGYSGSPMSNLMR